MNYSAEQYHDFLNSFCKEYPNYRKILFRPVFWESNLFQMNVTEMKCFLVDKVCANSRSLKYLQDVKNILNRFFVWCEKQEIIPYNIFATEEFDSQIIYEYMIQKMDITFFYEETITSIIQSLNHNKCLNEMLVRGFYEGIENVNDFAALKTGDFDFENHILTYRGGHKKMSAAFMEAAGQYMNCRTYEFVYRNKTVRKDLVPYEDYLLKYVKKDKEAEEVPADTRYRQNMQKLVQRYFERISKESGSQVTHDGLFICGFINYIKKRCDQEKKTNLQFLAIFRTGKMTQFQNLITEYAREYGMPEKIHSEKLRQRCYPYIVKSRYYKI